MSSTPVIVRVYNANCSQILAETIVNFGEEDALMDEVRPMVEKFHWHLSCYVPPVVSVFKDSLKLAMELAK